MLLQHGPQCPLCAKLVSYSLCHIPTRALLRLPPRNPPATYLQAFEDPDPWPELSIPLPTWGLWQKTRRAPVLIIISSSLCKGIRGCATAPPVRLLLFILPGSHSERHKRFQVLAGEASRNSSCSLAGSWPSWRDDEQLQMHVRKQRANVDSFTGGGVVGKACSDCSAAELNVPWTCTSLYPEGSMV